MKASQSIEIFQYMLDKNEFHLSKISNQFSISERTLRYEVEKLNEQLFEKNESKIEVDKGSLKHSNWEIVFQNIKSNCINSLSIQEREMYILLNIFLNREINQKLVGVELDISSTTVKTHFKEVKFFLDRYSLLLVIKSKKGLILEGKEENVRIGLLKVLNNISRSNSIFLKVYLKENFFKKIEKDGIKRFINYCQKLMNTIISDEAYKIIINYLRISLYMNTKNYKLIEMKNEKFLSETKEYRCIKKAASILEEWYEIELEEKEYLKITDYFLGSNTYNLNYSYYDNWVEIEIMLKEMIVDFNSYIKENIIEDKLLLEGLLNHIKPTIYRIKNKIELENSIYKEVLESYPNYFNITKAVLKKIEDRMNLQFTEDEISFLVIHFKAAIDRNKVKSKKKRVVLVCGSGYGTSKLLAQQLNQYYHLEIVDIIPEYLIGKFISKNEIDLILTTVDVKVDLGNKIILKLNPILTDEDKRKIEEIGIYKSLKKISVTKLLEVIKESCKELDEKELREKLKKNFDEHLIDDFFQEKNTIFDHIGDRILINEEVKNWKEAIRKVGTLLLKDQFIKESYIENSIKSIEEFGSYMILGDETLFPHTRTKGDVLETGFSIMTLKTPVILPTNKKVSVIIMFSSKNNIDHLDTFIKLVDLSNEDNFLWDIKKVKKSQDFIKILNK
ncbi:MAG: BglG family transcription antiterminator [Fusobacteriaceae bacterium]